MTQRSSVASLPVVSKLGGAPEGDSLAPVATPPTGLFLPHVAIHCYPTTPEGAAPFERFAADRRAQRATVEITPGGVAAAARAYETAPTPSLLVIESAEPGGALLMELDRLAERCEPDTHVIVVGHVNDIALYRALTDRGVADYLLAPVDPLALMTVALRLFRAEDEGAPIGRVTAVIGAKGGVGSSTIAGNVAWCMAQATRADTLLVDLDMSFGASSIAFDVEGGRGVAEALRDAGRLDAALLERLMTRKGPHLCLLPAPATLDAIEEPEVAAVEKLIHVTRRAMPFAVLDLPHHWNAWVRAALIQADAVAVVTSAGLAAMRNAGHLMETLKALRPNDPPPRLVVNRVGAARRGELSAAEVKDALGLEIAYEFENEPSLFAAADAKGAMLGETSGGARVRARFEALAADLAGRRAAPPKSRRWRLPGLLRRR